MRVLRLTNSNDVNPNVSTDANKAFVGERLLEEAVSESVETIIRVIWPAPELPDLIDRWIERHEPDVVFFLVSSYWFTYVSVPVKVERSFGPLGKPLAQAGLKLAAKPWLAHNAAFRGLRRATLATIGGATFFTPEQVNGIVEDCLRRIVRHENIAVAVRGPRIPFASEGSRRARRIAEERRQTVHRHVAALCEQLHIEYAGWDHAVSAQDDSSGLQGDLVHMNAALHASQGDFEGGAMLRAWQRTHAGPDQSPLARTSRTGRPTVD